MLDDDGIARLLGNVDSRCTAQGLRSLRRDRHVALLRYGAYVSKVISISCISCLLGSPGNDNDMNVFQ